MVAHCGAKDSSNPLHWSSSMSWARKVASGTDKLCITDGWEEFRYGATAVEFLIRMRIPKYCTRGSRMSWRVLIKRR